MLRGHTRSGYGEKGQGGTKMSEKEEKDHQDFVKLTIGTSKVYILGAIKGLKSEAENVKKAYRKAKPDVIGLHISPEEMMGLEATVSGEITEMGLSHSEEIYGLNLAVYGEVQVPPPSLVTAYRIARKKDIPLAPLDMNDEKYADIYTKTVSTFHLIRHSFRIKRLRKRKFNSPDARSFLLEWDSQINRVKGYREMEKARERYMADSIALLAKEHKSVLAVLELERLEGIIDILSSVVE